MKRKNALVEHRPLVSTTNRILTYLLSIIISISPLQNLSYASDIYSMSKEEFDQLGFSDVGAAGQALGQELVNKGQTYNEPINSNDLYPVSSDNFVGDSSANIENLKNANNNDEKLEDLGKERQQSLWADANQENPRTIEGSAYSVFNKSSQIDTPDMRNDPMFGQTNNVQGGLDQFEQSFSDCSYQETITTNNTTFHDFETKECHTNIDRSSICEIDHRYEAAVITHAEGLPNIADCSDENDCKHLWLGKKDCNNCLRGWCDIFEYDMVVKVVNPDAINSVIIEYAKWDDYMQIIVGKVGEEELVFQSHHDFPPEIGTRCELNSDHQSSNMNKDITKYFKDVEPDTLVRLKSRVSVGNGGESYTSIKLRYNSAKTVIRDEWSPSNCIESAIGVTDGYADGSVRCIDDPSGADGCAYTNGIKICSGGLKPSPVAGISNMCKKVAVNANYNVVKGQQDCYIDVYGNQQCPYNNGNNLNTCKVFEEDPNCGFISTECLEGSVGASGTCYQQSQTWQCGTTTVIPEQSKKGEYKCEGEIRCMGEECVTAPELEDQTAAYGKVAALAHIAQFMTQDMQCTGLDENGNATGEENVECSVFAGEAMECKIAVGGAANCCENPMKGVSLQDYLRMIKGAYPRVDQAGKQLVENKRIQDSGYKLIKKSSAGVAAGTIPTESPELEPTMLMVATPLVSYVDNAFAMSLSGVEDTYNTAGVVVEEAGKILIDQASTVFSNLMGLAASPIGNAAATAAAQQVAQEYIESQVQDQVISQGAGAVLGSVMAAYTAYVVAMAVIQTVYACEEEEIALAAKEEIKVCHKVGKYCKDEIKKGIIKICIEERVSYCCFNSPLSRIVQEGVRPQLGMSWGTKKRPSCGGIPFDKLSTINWDLVATEEWIGLLKQNGALPTGQDYNIESLTGNGNPFQAEGADRDNALERTQERVKDVEVDTLNIEIGGSIDRSMDGGSI